METTILWVWLAEAVGAGTAVWGKLRSMGYSLLQIYQGEKDLFAPLFPRQSAALTRLLDKSTAKAEAIVKKCQSLGIHIYHDGHPEYPKTLRELHNPPPVIYVKGNLSPKDWHFPVGIVGTRQPTDYGRSMAYALSVACAKEGAAVLSGLALGIDTVAHAGALAAGGKTVAVLASGVDIVTPAGHKDIAERICQNGALVSEYPPGTVPRTYHFPCRNRLVAALSSVLAVMEGGRDSGAMITAKEAMSLGRDLYALPGRVGERQAEGPMQLLADGAHLLSGADAIVRDYRNALASLEKPSVDEVPTLDVAEMRYGLIKRSPSSQKPKEPEKREEPRSEPKPIPDLSFLSEEEKALYLRIPADGSCLPDELVAEGVSAVQIMRWLTHLEMEGFINRLPGGRVSRTD